MPLNWHNRGLHIEVGMAVAYKATADGSYELTLDEHGEKHVVKFSYDMHGIKDYIGSTALPAAVIVSDSGKVVFSGFWAKIIQHDSLVDENGNPLHIVLGKTCRNVVNKAIKDPNTGKTFLRCTITLNAKKDNFWRINFDGNMAVAANGIYRPNKYVAALVRSIGPVTQNDKGVSEQTMEGVSFALLE